ncbi:ribbon-helix-helix domain-containing protein [Nodosilinea sp. FACHB-13]|uniref:ribbon-helix-helix domain-containing protein n=1 Tax=Cyanophyceae TaxID=3028117 RepID=UPI001685B2FF|nr:ribbon-helix-helix domain-containing protein [Nodosilinea sp. FACHB-13]MBD2109056.1 hypothetical protein [Nodosilinea sp. FACHB-13]
MGTSSNKRRVSVTIDAGLLEAIDQVSNNRSAVIEEALRFWHVQKINEKLKQYYQTQSQSDLDHEGQWADFAYHQLDETLDHEGL